MGGLAVDRFESLEPIRARGVIHFTTAKDLRSGRPCVVATAPHLPPSEARTRLSGLARVHALVAGPHVPATLDVELDGPEPWVALDCDAVADLETLQDFIRRGGEKPDFVRAAAVGKTIMETLVACHRVRDPESGRPVCLGSLARSNVLFAADGRLWLVGFGAGALDAAYVAPEVAAGMPPTSGADAFALVLFLRAQTDLIRVPSALRRVLAGRSLLDDAKLVLLFTWSNLQIVAAPWRMRPDMEAALVKAREAWRLLGIEPDVAGFSAWVARSLAAARAETDKTTVTPRGILVGLDGEWFETFEGARRRLGSRGPLRRLVAALAEARRDRAGAVLTIEELLQAGWPGENPIQKAGSNRVYVAIATLRKLGLGPLLQRWDNGYRLDPSVPCRFELAAQPEAGIP
jgi:hypothetical protein